MTTLFDTSEMMPETFWQCMKKDGGVLLRNALNPGYANEMRGRAVAIYEEMDRLEKCSEMPEHLKNAWQYGHVESLDISGEQPGFIYQAFVRSPVLALAKRLWPEGMVFIGGSCVPRRQIPNSANSNPVPYHQDESFLKAGCLVLNFWMPLMDAGVKAPGLEIIRQGFDKTLTDPKSRIASYDDIEIPASVMDQFSQDKAWHPEVKAGDALVFSNYTLHKTYMTPDMTQPRIAIEMRCTSAHNKAALRRPDLVPIQW